MRDPNDVPFTPAERAVLTLLATYAVACVVGLAVLWGRV